MPARNKHNGTLANQHGMTLLEILLALLIVGTVMTMVSMTLAGSMDILNATRAKGDIYHRAQVALLRISEDLASTILVDESDFIGSGENSEGQGESVLQFTSTAHVVFNREVDNPGLAVISYNVLEDAEQEGELLLVRTDRLLATSTAGEEVDPEEEGFVLCDRLRSVSFMYYNGEGEELEEWTTEEEYPDSDEVRKLPVAVSCTLEFWIDKEQDTSIEFTTRVLLPVGLIFAQNEKTTNL